MSTVINPYILGSGAPPFVPSAFDPASATGSYTWLESDRLATDAAATNDNSHFRSVRSYNSGKHKFELQSVVNTYSAQPALGLCNSASRGSYLGSNANSFAWYNTGEIYYNGGVVVSGYPTPLVIGGYMSMEVDLDIGVVYFQLSGGGRIAFSIPAGLVGSSLYICVGTFASGDRQRGNFGNAAWAVAANTGFENGW